MGWVVELRLNHAKRSTDIIYLKPIIYMTYFAATKLRTILITSKNRSRIKYLILSDNIIVIVWPCKLVKKNLISLSGFTAIKYDLLIIRHFLGHPEYVTMPYLQFRACSTHERHDGWLSFSPACIAYILLINIVTISLAESSWQPCIRVTNLHSLLHCIVE